MAARRLENRWPHADHVRYRSLGVKPEGATPMTTTGEPHPITFERLDPTGQDREQLVRFLTTQTFPFHSRPRRGRTEVEASIDAGEFRNDDNDTFWIRHEQHGRIGIVRLEDLTDPTPVFDLRLAERFRGKGLGTSVLVALTRHVFEHSSVHRFEGQTREDNVAMRRVFLRSGWVKEAHYRQAWPVEGGGAKAAIAYAILREDWSSGSITPVPWDDLTL